MSEVPVFKTLLLYKSFNLFNRVLLCFSLIDYTGSDVRSGSTRISPIHFKVFLSFDHILVYNLQSFSVFCHLDSVQCFIKFRLCSSILF
jgi:hypothetical protein